MYNNSFKIGTENICLGENSTILGGNNNFISFGATNISLQGCVNCVVHGSVTNFTGVGLSGVVIDKSYSNSILKGLDASLTITANTTLDRSYNGKTVYVDATSGNITIKWDLTLMVDCKVTFIRYDGSGNTVSIDSVSAFGFEYYVGHGLPFVLTFARYTPLKLTSISTTIYNTL